VLFFDIEEEAITCAPSRLGILMGGNKNSQKQTCESDFPSAINELPTFFLLL
jgi:hypothetical protein